MRHSIYTKIFIFVISVFSLATFHSVRAEDVIQNIQNNWQSAGKNPHIVTFGSDEKVVVWEESGTIALTRYDAQKQQWQAMNGTQGSETLSRVDGMGERDARNPQLVVTQQNTPIVAWEGHKTTEDDTSDVRIFVRAWDTKTKQWRTMRTKTTQHILPHSTTQYIPHDATFHLAIDRNGNPMIVTQLFDTKTQSAQLIATYWDDRAQTWKGYVGAHYDVISTHQNGAHITHVQMAYDDAEHMYIVWTSAVENTHTVHAAMWDGKTYRSVDGAQQYDIFSSDTAMIMPQIGVTTHHQPVIAYADSAHKRIVVRRYIEGAWQDSVIENERPTHIMMRVDAQGVPYIVWNYDGQTEIMDAKELKISRIVDGAPQSMDGKNMYDVIASGNAMVEQYAFALSEKNMPVIVWAHHDTVHYARYDGEKWTQETDVSQGKKASQVALALQPHSADVVWVEAVGDADVHITSHPYASQNTLQHMTKAQQIYVLKENNMLYALDMHTHNVKKRGVVQVTGRRGSYRITDLATDPKTHTVHALMSDAAGTKYIGTVDVAKMRARVMYKMPSSASLYNMMCNDDGTVYGFGSKGTKRGVFVVDTTRGSLTSLMQYDRDVYATTYDALQDIFYVTKGDGNIYSVKDRDAQKRQHIMNTGYDHIEKMLSVDAEQMIALVSNYDSVAKEYIVFIDIKNQKITHRIASPSDAYISDFAVAWD